MKFTKPFLVVFAMVASGLVGALIGLPVTNWASKNQPKPFVAVILSDDDAKFTIPEELEQGINQAMQASGPKIKTSNQDVAISFFPSLPNALDIKATVEEKCLDDDNCIAIVGNSDSTATTVTLDTIPVSYTHLTLPTKA